MSLPPRISLVGFMGAGKSTVGRLLAARTGYAFVDSDDEVESLAHAKVTEIFVTQGEAAFRKLESEAIGRLLDRDRIIIATGGGAFAEPTCAEALLERSLVVHLSCAFEEAFRRVSGQATRPLAQKGEAEAAGLYARRKDKYARAHVIVDTTHRSPADVATDVLQQVQCAI